MYLLVAEVLTKAGAEDRYATLLRATVQALSAEPCFVRFTIGRSQGDPRLFLLHEIWTSRDAYERLREGEAFRDYLSRRTGLVDLISRRDWLLVDDIRPAPA